MEDKEIIDGQKIFSNEATQLISHTLVTMQTVTIDRTREWAAEDYFLLGEIKTPCELINGELFISPAPTPPHQITLSNLNDIVKAEGKKVGGLVLFAPVDVIIDQKNIFQPDLIFLSKESSEFLTKRGIEEPPDLVVEIISPSNSYTDRYEKKDVYQKFGVKEYWILDPANQTLEIYFSDSWTKPQLYLAGDGEVQSSVLENLKFNFDSIF